MSQFWEATLGPGHMGPPQSHQFRDSASAARCSPTSLGPATATSLPDLAQGSPPPPSKEMLCVLSTWGVPS